MSTDTRTLISIRLRYFAAAKAAMGRAEDRIAADTGSTVGSVLDDLLPTAADAVTAGNVLSKCSYLVDGVATTDPSTPLRDGVLVDVLPPFAGG